jgi:hypothetical protein
MVKIEGWVLNNGQNVQGVTQRKMIRNIKAGNKNIIGRYK